MCILDQGSTIAILGIDVLYVTSDMPSSPRNEFVNLNRLL
jgi:hypothetical protein